MEIELRSVLLPDAQEDSIPGINTGIDQVASASAEDANDALKHVETPMVETLHSLLAEAGLSESSQAFVRELIDTSLAVLHSSADRPLQHTLQTHKAAFISLAESWLTCGAKACSIRGNDILFCWPESLSCAANDQEEHTLWAPLMLKEQVIGKIGVIGLPELEDPAKSARLQTDAMFISRLVALTVDLESACRELIARERLRVEMEVAASIQLRLLPQIFPQVQGLDIYAQSLPATQVGGDFYSFHTCEGRPFIFAAGDVSGKGLPAALLMVMVRTVLQSSARLMPNIHPRAILSRINEDLYDDFTTSEMFTTAFAGCYDPGSRQLTYANAGHSPVIHCPRGGRATMLEADGPALGILSLNLSQNLTIPFLPGDVMVVATDGFSEALNADGEMFGYERLLAAVEELAHLPADQIANELYTRIHLFTSGQEQSDDQTLVIIKGVEA